jgi:chitodextrinase
MTGVRATYLEPMMKFRRHRPNPPHSGAQPGRSTWATRAGRRSLLKALAGLAFVMAVPGAFASTGLLGGPSGRPVLQPHQRALALVSARRATGLTSEIRATASALEASYANAPRLSRQLVELSKERQRALVALIDQSPSLAAGVLLPSETRLALQAVPGAQVESRISLSGYYRIWHRDDFRNEANDVFRDQLATPDGKTITLAATDQLPRLLPGDRIRVTGYLVRDHLLVTNTGRAAVRVLASSTTTASTTGPINVAVITANFSDSTSSIDMSALKNEFQGSPGNDVVSYFNEASYGKASIVPSFFGPYRMTETAGSGCSPPNQTELMNLANADVDFTKFQRFVYVFNCRGYGSSASSAGPMSTPDGTVTAAVIAEDASYYLQLYTQLHELSHTLGSFNHHASMFVCLPDTFIPPTRFDRGCDVAEYGDSFDVLGGGASNATGELDPYHKSVAGWFDPSQYPTVTASGTYTLAPYETPGTGIAALNIPRGASGTSFTVEYRQPIGFDAWMASCSGCTVTQGASIRLAGYVVPGAGGGSDTEIVDTTPGTRVGSAFYYPITDPNDGALLPGKTFTDPEYGITIATMSAGPSGLVVQVTVPTLSCSRAAPSVSAPSPASQSAATGQTVNYTYTLTNADSAGCAKNSFRFFPTLSYPSMKVVATPDVLTLAPGASASINVSVTSRSTATAGSSLFSGGMGRFFSNTLGSYVTTVPGATYQLTSSADTAAPSTPASPVGKALGSNVASITWGASTDNVGVVGYQVTRNDSIYVTSTPSFLDTSLSPGTAYTYSIRAFDRNNNLSPAASASVTTGARTDTAPPTAPTLQAIATDRTLDVSWAPSMDNVGVVAYRLSPCMVALCASLPPTKTSLQIDGLTTQTKYDLTITAVDGDGNTAASNTFTVYTGPLGDSPPTQPQLFFSPSATVAGVTLSWSPSTDDKGVTGYEVYRNNRPVAEVAGTSFSDPIAGPHEYYVQALDASGGMSPPTPSIWAGMAAANPPPLDTTPPTATLTAPAQGASVSGTVPVTATGSDNVGVTRVEFYVDGALAATSYSSPFSFQWKTTGLADGSHWLDARAYDAAGNYGTSGTTSINIANGGGSTGDSTPPAVSILAPLNGITVSGSVTVSATATDNVGATKVEFSVDGSLLATSTSAPYGFAWDASTASAGSHTITATAYDAAGNSSTTSVTVSVAAPADTTQPTVSFASPAAGATVSGTIQVQASASDNVGVSKVELSVDGSLTDTLTASPWTFSLDTSTLANGSHTLSMTAYDAAGNSSSAQISVSVQNGSVDTTPPKAPSSLKAAVLGNTQIALYWTPSTDNVGVAGYDVYRDGVQISSTGLPNYLDSGLAPATSHTYQVFARDAAGNRSLGSRALSVKTVALSTAGTGTLAGVVYNALGRPLANVIVKLSGNGLTKSAKTNTSGVYKFTLLPPGTYTLVFTPPATIAAPATLTAQEAVPAPTAVAGQTIVLVTSF